MGEKKAIQLGDKPKRSDETRRALATVTPAREVKAREAWERAAPKGAEGMLDATTEKR